MKVSCEVGHVWDGLYYSIKAGHWCPECARRKKYSLEDAQNLAIKRNGKCLSEEYLGARENLKWKCNNCSNIWTATLSNVIRGTWCKICSYPRIKR